MKAGGDYLMVVKNQKSLYEDIELCFEEPMSGKYAYAETEGSHGAEGRRRLWATDMLRTYLARTAPGDEGGELAHGEGGESRQVRYA